MSVILSVLGQDAAPQTLVCVCEVESAVCIKCIDMNEKVLNVAYV